MGLGVRMSNDTSLGGAVAARLDATNGRSIRHRWRSLATRLVPLALAAASAVHAACPLDTPHLRVGANATYCSANTIQAAIDSVVGTCPVVIEVTREHLYDGGFCNANQPNGCHLSINGKSITLQGRADGETCYVLTQCIPGPSCPAPSATTPLVTLDGANNGRVLTISGASNVNLRNLTITHGDAGGGDGGGIDFTGSGNLNITRTTIATNHAGYGGGINANGTAALKVRLQADTLLQNNTAAISGGGVRLEGSARLYATSDRTLLSLNHALTGYGGGIEILGPARADIGSAGINGAGVVSNNDAVYGAGIAVIDNGNGGAVLRTFADAAGQPTEIEYNGGATNGGGIYTEGQADACLIATRVANNSAEDGAAIYRNCNGSNGGTCEYAYGTFINAGWPDRLGAECGPESVASLLGSVECAAGNRDCTGIDANVTKHPDGTPSAGATFHSEGSLNAYRFHMRGNVARYGIEGYAYYGQINRCLIADNGFSGNVMSMYGTGASLKACTITHNIVDGAFVLEWGYVADVTMAFDIIDQPGRYTINWFNYSGNGLFDISYTMASKLDGMPQNNPSIVQGAPAYLDPAAGDYHLKPIVQTALDFGGDNGIIDLDGQPPFVDLPKANFLGSADLGPYELQALFNCGTNDTIFCDKFEP